MELATKFLISMRFLTNETLINPNTTIIDNKTITTNPNSNSSIDEHKKNIWLLVIDLLVFIALTFLSYTWSKKKSPNKIREIEEQQNTSDFRSKFTRGLVLANGIRAISLVIIIAFDNNSGNNARAWLNFLAHCVPAVIFLSAYMEVVTVLTDTYYSTISYQNHLVKPSLHMMAAASYITIGLLAFFTFVTKSYRSFGYISEFLIGVGYTAMGFAFMYFGEKVASLYNQKGSPGQETSNNETGFKVLAVSISIGVLFVIKGLCGLLTAFGAFGDLFPISIGPNIWDFFMFLITEICPTLIFLGIAKYYSNNSSSQDEEIPDSLELNEIHGEKYSPPTNNGNSNRPFQ